MRNVPGFAFLSSVLFCGIILVSHAATASGPGYLGAGMTFFVSASDSGDCLDVFFWPAGKDQYLIKAQLTAARTLRRKLPQAAIRFDHPGLLVFPRPHETRLEITIGCDESWFGGYKFKVTIGIFAAGGGYRIKIWEASLTKRGKNPNVALPLIPDLIQKMKMPS